MPNPHQIGCPILTTALSSLGWGRSAADLNSPTAVRSVSATFHHSKDLCHCGRSEEPPYFSNTHSRTIVTSALFGLLIASIPPLSQAQSAPCGLSAMEDSTQLVYPPIAKAAHVTGVVVLLATFDHDGSVKQTTVVSGPKMLQTAAISYVSGLRANRYSGPRQCPIAVAFRVEGESVECGSTTQTASKPQPVLGFRRIDLQHVTIAVPALCFYSQPAIAASAL